MADSTTLSKAIVVQTQEEERYRLARALQEGPAQLLANAAVEIETSLRLLDDQPAAARAGLLALAEELRQGLQAMKDLIADLQPPLLEELGLSASLQKHAESFSVRTGIATRLIGWESLSERLPPTMQVAIFRIVQNALENVRAHAHATRAEICLERHADHLVVSIEDNGQGFAVSDVSPPPRRRLGLVAMSDRAELLGGQLQVFSDPARGVRVVLTIPYKQT